MSPEPQRTERRSEEGVAAVGSLWLGWLAAALPTVWLPTESEHVYPVPKEADERLIVNRLSLGGAFLTFALGLGILGMGDLLHGEPLSALLNVSAGIGAALVARMLLHSGIEALANAYRTIGCKCPKCAAAMAADSPRTTKAPPYSHNWRCQCGAVNAVHPERCWRCEQPRNEGAKPIGR